MRKWRLFGLTFGLVAALALGHFVAAGMASGAADEKAGGEAVPAKGQPAGAEELISFKVRLPADAVLEIDGKKTTSTGETRTYQTPPLRVGGKYVYTLKATANGKEVTRKIDLAHGAENSFDLRSEFRPGGANRSESARITETGQQEPSLQTGVAKGKRARDFIAAFEKGDAKGVAAFWMPDAVYVDENGRHFKGRPAIEQMYEKFFAKNKGLKLNIIVTSARMVGADVGLEEGLTEVTPAGGGLPSTAGFSAVLVKKDGEWYFESVHDTVARPPSNAAHFDDLDWLIGDWTGETEKGESGKASYAWAENKNFIVSNFATTLDGVPVVGGTQWLAWDAVDKQIRSWSFYSGGGFGEATWTQDGNKWTTNVTARTAAGKKASATNVLTKVDDDHCTWQITKLIVDGKPIPDPQPLKLKRVRPPQP
jgi:uncharacterized protein (TIGR02246 family)